MGPIIVLAATLGLTWLLFILPQQRRIKAHQAVVASLEVGDEVMTTSGMYGTVTELDEETATLEIAPGTAVRFARGAVAQRLVDEEPGGDATHASEPGEPAAPGT
jgi:preprotein translocase subunit YajC